MSLPTQGQRAPWLPVLPKDCQPLLDFCLSLYSSLSFTISLAASLLFSLSPSDSPSYSHPHSRNYPKKMIMKKIKSDLNLNLFFQKTRRKAFVFGLNMWPTIKIQISILNFPLSTWTLFDGVLISHKFKTTQIYSLPLSGAPQQFIFLDR